MKTNYTLEKEFLKKVEIDDETNKREISTDDQIKDLLSQYPKLPGDYISYLKEIGQVVLGNVNLMSLVHYLI